MLIEHQATRIAWLVINDAALITSVEEACIAYFEPVCNIAADARDRPTQRPNVWLGVDVGRRVRRIRRAKDVTQVQFAAQTGLNRMTISRLENGTAKVVYGDTIVALARALGVSADYLLGLSEREEGGVTDTVTDTSALRQMLEQGLRAGTVTDTLPIRRMLRQEFDAFLDARTPLVQAILQAQPVTDTVTDTQSQPDEAALEAARTLAALDAAAKPKAKAARQRAVPDTVPDTEAPARPASNAQRRKRLPVAY